MKFVALAIVMVGLLPFANWLRQSLTGQRFAWMAVGLLPFFTATLHLLVAPISWPEWPGFVKGMEITGLDFIAIALWIVMPRSKQRLTFPIPMLAYFFVVFLSLFVALQWMATVFYLWQLLRLFLIFSLARRAALNPEAREAILTGMLIGVCLEGVIVFVQRFVLGDIQTPGTVGHQNTLGMMTHLAVFPYFALLLAGRKGWQPFVAPLAGAEIALLTVSRGTIATAALGYFALFVIKASRKWTPRVTMVALLGLTGLAVAVPFAVASFEKRFAVNPLSDDYDERAAFEKAASMMVADYPFGVGANNFVLVANTGGYYDKAGVIPTRESRAAHVHNAYWLAAAETGYLGLITFIAMLAQPLLTAFKYGFRCRDSRGDLLLGLGVSLAAVYLQSFYEWTFFLYYPQYMFAISAGLISGLAWQIRTDSRRKATAASSSPHASTRPTESLFGSRQAR